MQVRRRKMEKKVKILMLIAVFSILYSFSVEAVTTLTWRETDQSHFDKGELQNVSTTSEGEIVLGPAVELVYDSTQLYIWSLAVDAQGIIYVGSGNNGAIYKIEKGKGSLLYDSPQIAIHSLALDREGNLYAGSSPRGIIYKIRPGKTETQVLADLEEEYIWALTFDSQGNLYAGTGQRGRIYRISPDGEVELLFDSPESHILSLIVDKQDNLYAGSEGQGVIYRINKEGEVFALYDPPQNEVRTLALDSQGNLYAGTLEKGTGSVNTSPALRGLPFPLSSQLGEENGLTKITASIVYKITPEGNYREWFRCLDSLLLSMLIDDRDNLYLGTGNRGLIYKISPQQEAFTLIKAPEPQVLSLAPGGKDSIYFGSGNLGRLYTFSSIRYAKEGTFESKVYDASFISRWGNIAYKGERPRGTTITLATRSGNTARPDDTWSKWSKEYKDPQGEPVTSPLARFIQYRARLSTRDRLLTPVIEEVSLALLPRNQAPQITVLNIPPSENEKGGNKNGKEGEGASFPGGNKGKSKKSEITVSWKATDPNGDALLYDLYFRGEGEESWKELKREIRETSYSWDSLTFPDGIYFVKLRVSDSPNNPSPYALTDEEISQPFLIDNTRPTVENLKTTLSGKVATVRGRVVDNLSPIKGIEYSVDAGDWIAIYPLDEIFDSLSEPFEFTTTELSLGEHTLILRVTDEAGNVGSAKTIISNEGK